jgi:hypothetical protein
MNKSLSYITLAFMLVGIAFSSCKKGNTIGSIGFEDTVDIVPFDTFVMPNANYFFWGVFDGHFKKWEHDKRSEWDTITRFPLPGQENDPWSTWPLYTDNIYTNVCNDGVFADCPISDDKDDEFYKFQTRFIRTDFPEERIAINFYSCVNVVDTFTSQYFTEFPESVLTEGAWPFSNLERGEWGAEVVFTDDQRRVWRTESGSGKATDSYLRITDFYPKSATDTLDTFATWVIEGEFAGRIYNGANQIAVTIAKFRARMLAANPLGYE